MTAAGAAFTERRGEEGAVAVSDGFTAYLVTQRMVPVGRGLEGVMLERWSVDEWVDARFVQSYGHYIDRESALKRAWELAERGG